MLDYIVEECLLVADRDGREIVLIVNAVPTPVSCYSFQRGGDERAIIR